MNQLPIVQLKNGRDLLRTLQITFTVLALLSFALGSVLLSLMWFGTSREGRAFVIILLWPATMLATWLFSMFALVMTKRWLFAVLSFPVAIAIFYGVWLVIVLYFNNDTVIFAVLFLLLNIGSVQIARWWLKSTSKETIRLRYPDQA